MALNAFRGSNLGAFIRSTLRARETDIPIPPVSDLDYLACHAYVRAKSELPIGGTTVCDSDSINYCQSLTWPGAHNGYGLYQIVLRNLKSSLNWKNLPLEIEDTLGNTIVSIPAMACDPSYWGTSGQEKQGDILYTFFHESANPSPPGGTYSPSFEAWLCSENHIASIPAVDEILSVRITRATWSITNIDAANRWITIGVHYLLVDDVLSITGTDLNDGEKTITAVDNVGGRVRFAAGELVDESAKGTAVLVVGRWSKCGPIFSVGLPDFGLYPPRVIGIPLPFWDWDEVVLLSGSGVYDGSSLLVRVVGTNDLLLGDRTWQGDVSTGSWVNNAVIITTSGHFLFSGDVIAITGVNGYYDGEWLIESSLQILDSNRFFIWPAHFVGTDSGEFQRYGIRVTVTGIPAGMFQYRDVQISGTGLYDGVYIRVIADDIDGTTGELKFGPLGDVKFIGDATGTWVDLDDPTLTGTILSVRASAQPVQFTSASPETSGTITSIENYAKRITTTPDHGVVAGDKAFLLDASGYLEQEEDVLGSVNAITFDVEGPYTVTSTGTWVAG